MSHTLYCDRCGRSSRSDVEPHEERNILPGPCPGSGSCYAFIRLDAHREMTGDRIWCEFCWDEVTGVEIDHSWKEAFEDDGERALTMREYWRLCHRHRHWTKARCFECGHWLEVPRDCPTVETTQYTVILGTAGEPIDGWFYGVFFKEGVPIDVRCPRHQVAA